MLIISNPASGHKKGPKIIEDFVLPLLNKYSIGFTLKATNAPGHAGELAKEYTSTLDATDKAIILVSGGDGTIHEIINALYADLASSNPPLPTGPELQLILLNSGTANALFHSIYPLLATPDVQEFVRRAFPTADIETVSQLQSVVAYIRGANNTRPLTLARNTTFRADGTISHCLLSVVVASTALHANLLHTSEELRDSIPGVERFTEAAKRNLDKWSHAKVYLKPVSQNSPVQIYEASSDSFIGCSFGQITLDGPFAYFLSTLNVDRLESSFVITPLATRIKPDNGSMDIVVIRPLRSPQITEDSSQSRKNFAQVLMGSMGAARSATHLNVRYYHEKDSQETPSARGDGPSLVEYYRCAGWEWVPESGSKDASYMCVDGAILEVEDGGRATSECITSLSDGHGIKVFV
ncbi:diacylglycerol kinase catalytic domain-containing protein [Ceratobasidium sp. AG-Ba]|nr:diacylglycerol kinase catalytic domain-containing protein [Ceratobasidium sp. AG-Ba]